MDTWLAQLKPQAPVYPQILASDLPLSIRQFVANTFGLIEEGKLHKIAAAFTFGREDLIPDMFLQLVKQLEDQNPDQLATFSYYLHRHIEVDGGEHGPIALRLVEKLCGADSLKWAEASQAAKASLQARIGLWDGVLAALPQVLVSDEHRLS
jgi:pyrroloquinoline quinone (PQQ) biosynthesis protein C